MLASAGSASSDCAVHRTPAPDPIRKLSRRLSGWAPAGAGSNMAAAPATAILQTCLFARIISIVLVAIAVAIHVAIPKDAVGTARHRFLRERIGGEAGIDGLVLARIVELPRKVAVDRPLEDVGAL